MTGTARAVLWSSVLTIMSGIAGCKGDSSSSGTPTSPTPPTPPVVSGAPTAAFTVAASVNALDPVTFDASASTSTDGSALQYVWDFGNGQRGGGKAITRTFGTGGTRTVTLTVFDGANRSGSVSHAVTVAAPPAPIATLSVQVSVTALDSTAIGGVTVTQVAGTATAVTDSTGKARLTLGTGSPLVVRFSKTGYADQFLPVTLPGTTGSDAYVAVRMRPRDAALTLADAAVGGSLTGRDGAVITVPANALVNAAGTAVSGPVQISITPVDPTLPGGGGFPGSFNGLTQAGAATPIVSFGTTEYVLSAGGQSVQVAPGKSATIELPLYATKRLDGTILAAGDTTPLWSLDESTGSWVQEGKGTVVTSANTPSGIALRATVTHFSWWNSDIGFDPYGPDPKCVDATNVGIPGGNDNLANATICNMLAEIDQTIAGGPRVVSPKSHVAAALSPIVAGFSRRSTVPIAGGVRVVVPANVAIRLTGTALNGTWGGSVSVNGPVGAEAEVLVPLRPLFTVAGTTPEAITIPFDATRSVSAAQPTARFTFQGDITKYARVQVTAAPGAVLSGTVRLLQGTTVLGSVALNSGGGQLIVGMPSSATQTVEVAGGGAAAFRLQVDFLGGLQSEALALPVDVTKSLAAYVTYNGTLTVTAPTTIYLARSVVAGGQADVRMLAPNGGVLLDGTTLPDAAAGAAVNLPAAGTYTLEIRPRVPANTTSVRATIVQTSWAQLGPTLDGVSILSLVDAISDRNGKVVVGYTQPTTQNGHAANRIRLQRWTGTAWESVAADLIIEQPCYYAGSSVSFAFDHSNRPVVLSSSNPGTGTFVTASRYVAGAWQALGPNGGTLPRTSVSTAACSASPSIAFGGEDAPLAAYQSDNNIVVQRFDGTQWKGLAFPDSGDTFPLTAGTFDLKVDDATNGIWLTTGKPYGSSTPALLRRFNSGTSSWDTIGGSLPQNNIAGLDTPRLRFDQSGLPQIAWIAQVGSQGASTAGVTVDRYDGAAWQSTGGFVAAGSHLINNSLADFGFALSGAEAIVSFSNQKSGGGNQSYYGVVTQRNTAAGWTPIGAGIGEVPQFTVSGVNDMQSIAPRVVTIGSETYLVLISFQGTGVSGAHIVLLHKVAN